MSFSIRNVKIDDVQGKLLMLPATLYETVHISIKSSKRASKSERHKIWFAIYR